MSRKFLIIGTVVVVVAVIAAFALGAFFGPRLAFGPVGFGPMGYGMGAGMMHGPGMMGGGMHSGWSSFGWGGMLLFSGLGLLGWLVQVALIAGLVAWLLKPRTTQNQSQ